MAKKFRKRADLTVIMVPGLGVVRDDRIIEGDQYAALAPALLEEVSEGSSEKKAEPARKDEIPPPRAKESSSFGVLTEPMPPPKQEPGLATPPTDEESEEDTEDGEDDGEEGDEEAEEDPSTRDTHPEGQHPHGGVAEAASKILEAITPKRKRGRPRKYP